MATFILHASIIVPVPTYVFQPTSHVFSNMSEAGREWMQPRAEVFHQEGIASSRSQTLLQ